MEKYLILSTLLIYISYICCNSCQLIVDVESWYYVDKHYILNTLATRRNMRIYTNKRAKNIILTFYIALHSLHISCDWCIKIDGAQKS